MVRCGHSKQHAKTRSLAPMWFERYLIAPGGSTLRLKSSTVDNPSATRSPDNAEMSNGPH